MSTPENLCLSLAIARLTYGKLQGSSVEPEHFAIWVLKAPYPGGYVHHDCIWPQSLTQTWLGWQEMFSSRGLPHVPLVHNATKSDWTLEAQEWEKPASTSQPSVPAMTNYSSRLMQHLGISLWQWLFEGSIQNSLSQSQGMAMGQNKPLRLRLEIRDPDLIALPWEIMQSQAGKQAISLSQQLLFSRTTSDVDPLPPQRIDQSLNILLVLGQDAEGKTASRLQLEEEAAALQQILAGGEPSSQDPGVTVKSRVDILLQPTPAELIERLETERYNILFYAGHGIPAPDGGLLFLRSDATLNGTEFAQVLVRCRVKLAVFNTCWGAQPDQQQQKSLPRSSLAEVLIHHGVPAVLGMRDSIADREALSFIQAFAQALIERFPIDRAVAVARQHLLTLYKFNQPAWSLPVLYMHPEFDGELTPPIGEGITELPGIPLKINGRPNPVASLRSSGAKVKVWPIRGGLMRVGRQQDNDLAIQEQWVSQKHAEIICRDSSTVDSGNPAYFLRDFSRFGTMVLSTDGWQKVHHQEVPLPSGCKLKFGSTQGQTFEFTIES